LKKYLFIQIKVINKFIYFIIPEPLQNVQVTTPFPTQKAQSPIFVSPYTQTTQLFSPSPSHTQQSFVLLQLVNNKQIINNAKSLNVDLGKYLCIFIP
tara:strand:+ start:449 stop:739 length:291 start_codon:yes stop_codon:yes gene_type:complete